MDFPEITQAAANMPPDGPIQSSSMAGAEDNRQQTANAAPVNFEKAAASHGGSTSHSSPSEVSSTSQAATGDKRK